MTDFVEFLSLSGSGDVEDNSTVTCTASSLQTANGMALPVSLGITVRVIQTLYGLLILLCGSFF